MKTTTKKIGKEDREGWRICAAYRGTSKLISIEMPFEICHGCGLYLSTLLFSLIMIYLYESFVLGEAMPAYILLPVFLVVS